MENTINIIWDYIDGNLQGDQLIAFEEQLRTDNDLKKLYMKNLEIHDQLKSMPLTQAPSDLSVNVLNAINKKTSYLSIYDSFMGLKIIFGGFILMVAIACLYFTLGDIDVPGAPNPIMVSIIDFLSFDIPSWSLINNFLPYSLVLISILFLVWIDNYLQRRTFSRVTML